MFAAAAIVGVGDDDAANDGVGMTEAMANATTMVMASTITVGDGDEAGDAAGYDDGCCGGEARALMIEGR